MDKSLSMGATNDLNFHDCSILCNGELLTKGFLIHLDRHKVQPIDEPKPFRRLTEAGQEGALPLPTCPEMSNNLLKANTMKTSYATTALVLALGLTAGASFAADSAPQSRLNNVATSSFFAKSAPSVLSRAEVKAAYISAQAAGNVPAFWACR
jgi:hypothetical protein